MWCCHKLLRLWNHNCSLANYGSRCVVLVSKVLLHIRHSLCMLSVAASSELQQELSICERDHVTHTSKLYTSWPPQEMLTVFHLGVWGAVLGSLVLFAFPPSGEELWQLVLGIEEWAVPGALNMGTLEAQACGDSQSPAQHAQNSAFETTGAAAGWHGCSFLCCVNLKLSYLWGRFLHICSYRNRLRKHFLMHPCVMWDKLAFWSETNLLSNPDSVTSLMTELFKGLSSLSVKW